ncbi:SusC/RagA family TonB-linked outer membrane protein [Mucilaginibacter phyllosphaerae]|uniref:TonB-dependent receptor n=1 Tax=Mucilaginibacter phyllosphaerae TaxID=1812349 RepID=A0A4Y8AI34_9SPHI|nr:TonB-dependent receptor [Mucilaginibacter phyllosphaerae]MBB3968260.1 TonB-linked SusC/RagA family outer membrane protein [Mucilaginibacter phyllosphaerae]TEW68733.1 TonB-dependent receptor [Mucilaginibacter phyllosphaerae]GGH00130.1 SusC/RagA family TonB-linked outer membrane protein [Mucilaginibacter phyllosphaerae]
MNLLKDSSYYKRGYEIIICFILSFIFIISSPGTGLAQKTEAANISGQVTTQKGEPLAGVTVNFKGTTIATSTDVNGRYQLKGTGDILVFTYIGFVKSEIPVNGRSVINAQLAEDAKTLDAVVIVAYGNTTQRTSTGALQTVNAKELQDIPSAQVTQKLQGKLAGVQITQATGKPGQGIQVRIRGSASISAGSDPLYVVDGFPIVGDISSINSDEIETISVLKDAASTSLYGSRAANGVVLITTKRGKTGKTNINFSSYVGIQQVPQKGRPDMMDATEFAQFKKESYEDLGQPVPAAFQNPAQYGKGYDWYNALLRSAIIENYSLSINTGTEKSRSAITGSYFNQDGVLLNSNYKRFSLRANNDYDISNNIKVGFNIAPSYVINNAPATDGLFYQGGGLINNALLTWPTLPIYNPDGSLTNNANGVFPTPNWVNSIQQIENITKTTRLLTNAYVQYQPINGLTLKSTINVDLGQSTYNNFNPSTASRGFASVPPVTASGFESNNRYTSWLNENLVTYKRSFGEHTIELLGGYTIQSTQSNYNQIRGTNYPDDRIHTIQSAVNIDRNNTYQDIQQYNLLSYISRLNYNYKGRYLLTASLRRDGSSRFGANNKYGNFPSVSLGWNISDESFMQNISQISLLKVRSSYGVTGNNNIGNYTQYANINSSNAIFGSTVASGIAVTSIGNSRLGWETTKQFDIGLDLAVLNNRLTFTYDYYNKRTTNLLFNLPVAQESGFSNFIDNVGDLQFWGHEFTVTSNNFTGTFKWNTNFNISFSDNKVLALSGLSDRIYGDHTITKVGGRIGQLYGLVQEGVYKNQAEFDSSPKLIDSQVGTIKYKDVNGDGVITSGGDNDDRTVIGNPFPKFTYGITNNFAYKQFDLTIVGAGSYGNKIMSLLDEGTTNLDGVFNVLKDVKYRWRSPENPGAGKYGKTTGSTANERALSSTHFLQSGSFFTIKNITLGYTIPFANNKYLNNLRLYTSVQQAFVFTNYKGANPEVSTDANGNQASALGQGLDYSAYPVPRTFTFGINVGIR